MQDSGKWRVESVPEYVSQLNEAQLATSTPHNLEPFDVPREPPCLREIASLKPLEVRLLPLKEGLFRSTLCTGRRAAGRLHHTNPMAGLPAPHSTSPFAEGTADKIGFILGPFWAVFILFLCVSAHC